MRTDKPECAACGADAGLRSAPGSATAPLRCRACCPATSRLPDSTERLFAWARRKVPARPSFGLILRQGCSCLFTIRESCFRRPPGCRRANTRPALALKSKPALCKAGFASLFKGPAPIRRQLEGDLLFCRCARRLHAGYKQAELQSMPIRLAHLVHLPSRGATCAPWTKCDNRIGMLQRLKDVT